MKKTLLFSVLATVALCIFAFTTASHGYEPGAVAQDFKLKNTDGKMVSLADYKQAKGFIVVFTCNHCPYAKSYEKRLIAIDAKYKALGYPVIAIMPNDTIACPDDAPSKMPAYAKEKGFTFPYLFDGTQATAKAYGAMKTPHVYVLQKEKKDLVVKYVGAIDDNYEDANMVKSKYLENAMTELLAGKDITEKTTKAIGCTIKWTK
jgi:peroxiredoxin